VTHPIDFPPSASFDQALSGVVEAATRALPSFRERLVQCELRSDDICTVDDLRRLPVLTKDDLLEAQAEHPPFGGLVADEAQVRRVFQSPGPIYEPQLDVPDHWGAAPALVAAGFGASDLVMNCFGYHLVPAGALFEDACFALGASVMPAGTGAKDLQVRAIADLGVTAYVGTPSYLKALMDAFDAAGFDASQWRIDKAVVSAEPLPDSLRRELSQRVATVHMAYGTAQTGILAYEDAPGKGLQVREDVLVQLCDIVSGEPVTEGEGQIVVTLMRPEYPLIRFGTGDISAWSQDDENGGSRLVGILGHVGHGVKVRGMFLHPAQVQKVLAGEPAVGAYRMIVERHEHRDRLRCEVVILPGHSFERVKARLTERVRSGLRFGVEITEVSELADGGPVIDDRRTWD
jgi:phenylacetate-CoA ligase